MQSAATIDVLPYSRTMPDPSEARILVPPPRRLYFAYGSNLWLKQMATRCPKSYYIGWAVLPDYLWQINQRGFANVTRCSGYSVHGLVYELGPGDEDRLDQSEGVSTGAYSKARLSVVLHAAKPALQLPTRRLVKEGGPVSAMRAVWRRLGHASTSEPAAYLEADVLVYLSEDYVQRGVVREEYIDRMNQGIHDAVDLGVPADFFENVVRPWIPDRPILQPIARRMREPPSQAPPRAMSSRSRGNHRRSRSASADVEHGGGRTDEVAYPRSHSHRRSIDQTEDSAFAFAPRGSTRLATPEPCGCLECRL